MSVSTHEYKVTMTCEGCSGAVERVLKKNDQVKNIDISLEKQTVNVTTSLTSEQVLEIIKKTGKAVEYLASK